MLLHSADSIMHICQDRVQSVSKNAEHYGYIPHNVRDVSSIVCAVKTNVFSSVLSNHSMFCISCYHQKRLLHGYNCGNVPTTLSFVE